MVAGRVVSCSGGLLRMNGMRYRLLVAMVLVGQAGGQTLAHKNWAGSGMSAQSWWERAVFCRVSEGATLKQAEAQMDRMQAMGCDAVVLSPLGAGSTPVDAKLGSIEDADALIEDVGHRKMRLVLDLALAGATEEELTGRMRLWLNRGVAGFVLVGQPVDPGMVKRLRQVVAGALGVRVLIGDGAVPDAQMMVRHLGGGVAAVRAELAGASGPVVLSGSVGAAKVSAAVLLGNGAAAELPVEAGHAGLKAKRAFSADELMIWVPVGDASLVKQDEAGYAAMTAWDAKLVELHHGHEALRTGQATYLDHDAQGVLAWVVKGRVGVAPAIVLCNLSGKPVKVALRAEVKALGVKGGYLRPLLRSEEGKNYPSLDGVELGVDEVLVGEIR